MKRQTFILSCLIFGGYSVELPVEPDQSLDTLVNQVVQSLRTLFKTHNLEGLMDMLNKQKYHIHDKTIQDILNNTGPIYICNCKSQ